MCIMKLMLAILLSVAIVKNTYAATCATSGVIAHCSSCETESGTDCNGCAEGYYLDPGTDSSCSTGTGTACATCNGAACATCKDGN